MSEQGEEPGIIMPLSFGEHLSIILLIRPFQIRDVLNTKFSLDISKFTLGNIIINFECLLLSENKSYTDIGVLYFMILKSSINVCWI